MQFSVLLLYVGSIIFIIIIIIIIKRTNERMAKKILFFKGEGVSEMPFIYFLGFFLFSYLWAVVRLCCGNCSEEEERGILDEMNLLEGIGLNDVFIKRSRGN